MFGMGMGEVMVIGLILFLFMGPKKLPELGKSIGQSINLFKKEMSNKELTESKKE
jgi:sec-independent protein translocase protein TatA